MPLTIVIFCRHFQEDKLPFSSTYYWHAYIDLLLSLKHHGADAYFATSDSYEGNGRFSVAYTADQKVPVTEFRKVRSVTTDIVYDKGGFNRSDDVTVLNPSFVHSVTANKATTYEHFAEYQPISMICRDDTQIVKAIEEIVTDKVVIKTPTGNGGHGVLITDKDKAIANRPEKYPVIVQGFMDTSIGIDGLVEGYHDLRLKVGGGEIWSGTLRTPAPGEYRANIAQGGTERHLFPSEIPSDAKKFALEIDSFFAGYPRYYAIDLANTSQGWRLIELNSKPGLSPVHFSDQSRAITNRLAEYLVQLAREARR